MPARGHGAVLFEEVAPAVDVTPTDCRRAIVIDVEPCAVDEEPAFSGQCPSQEVQRSVNLAPARSHGTAVFEEVALAVDVAPTDRRRAVLLDVVPDVVNPQPALGGGSARAR